MQIGRSRRSRPRRALVTAVRVRWGGDGFHNVEADLFYSTLGGGIGVKNLKIAAFARRLGCLAFDLAAISCARSVFLTGTRAFH